MRTAATQDGSPETIPSSLDWFHKKTKTRTRGEKADRKTEECSADTNALFCDTITLSEAALHNGIARYQLTLAFSTLKTDGLATLVDSAKWKTQITRIVMLAAIELASCKEKE